ncbi:MAG: LysM peptidoglycan-binding domain-containing protein, partial [bacterium]|nr:LysM peptidoglycan-binding domain-containing protein [bacterium]
MKVNFFYLLLPLFLLLVPLSADASYDRHITVTVEKGDNLSGICKKYLEDPGDCPWVAMVNRIKDPEKIFPGQKLIIPGILLKGNSISAAVTFIKGDVNIQAEKDGPWIPLHLNDLVKQGSRIKTGKESVVEITFEDGSSILLRSDTTFGVTAARERDTFYTLRSFFLKIGRTVSTIKKATGQQSRFEIHTPTTVAAARGT